MSTWQSPEYYKAHILAVESQIKNLPSWSSPQEASDRLATVGTLLGELRKINTAIFSDRQRLIRFYDTLNPPARKWSLRRHQLPISQDFQVERQSTLDQYGALKLTIDHKIKDLAAIRKKLNKRIDEQRYFAPIEDAAIHQNETVASWWDFPKTAIVTDVKSKVSICTYCSGLLSTGDLFCPSCGTTRNGV